MADVRATWRSGWFDALGAGTYDFVVERERLARRLGRLVWGTDMGLLYERLGAISKLPDGSAILDVPCGGGLAFRALRPDQDVRYIAADLSTGMLRRAQREADRRGLHRIELVEADVESLPFDDASFHLCVSFNSLHCFADPGAALREMARCLRPDGRLIADTAVRGAGARFDRLIDLYARRGIFGHVGTIEDLRSWLADAALDDVSLQQSGAIAHFTAEPRASA
jgi:ubiquinone/menaquinone biosynthesis C-methylase UbiE